MNSELLESPGARAGNFKAGCLLDARIDGELYIITIPGTASSRTEDMEAAWNLAFWAPLILVIGQRSITRLLFVRCLRSSRVMLVPFAWLLSIVLVVHVSDAMPKRTRGVLPEPGQRALLALDERMEDQIQ